MEIHTKCSIPRKNKNGYKRKEAAKAAGIFMISIQNLVKRYGSNYALDDISLEIKEGEIVGLLGPNGAGKSTTMNILTGYLSATSGVAKINGIDILENPVEAKKYIGYLPEQPPLYQDMTVMEYLNFVYELKKCTLDRKAHLAEVCEVVKLTDVSHRLIRNLSKGYRQRVGIAQAIIGNPPVIIFDEPTVGLDPKQIIEIRNLLRLLGKKHTVILSTHILSEVQAVCERIIIIDKGKIIANELTSDITRTLEDERRLKVKICAEKEKVVPALSGKAGISSVEALGERDGDAYSYIVESERGIDIRRAIFRICADANMPILEMAPLGEELEDIFIRLIDRDAKQKNKR